MRLDSRTAPPIGSFAVGSTGGWQTWRTVCVTLTSGRPTDFVGADRLTSAR